MKRYGLTFLFVYLSFAGVVDGQSDVRTDRERAHLISNVRTVRERSYSYMGLADYKKDGPAKHKFDTGDTVTYDLRGNEIERIMVSDYGESIGKQTQRFTSDGKIMESVFTNAKGQVEDRTAYRFENGRLTQVLRYDAKGVLREKTVREFDARGALIEEVYFDPTTARARTTFKNNSIGQPTEMAFFLTSGEKAIAPLGPCLGGHRVTVTLDSAGRVVSKTIFDTADNIKKSFSYTYNARGQVARQITKTVGSTTTTDTVYEYDHVGNWTKATAANLSDSSLLEGMLKATGKKATPAEISKMNEMSKITRVTVRTITYY